MDRVHGPGRKAECYSCLRVSGWKGAWCGLGICDCCPNDSLRVAMSIFLFQSKETREILHFHYTTWPDFGVPESPASFLNFLFKVRESGSLSQEHGPIVVHCSAGIGRSGTFCLADTCLLLVRRPLETPGRDRTTFKSPLWPGHSSSGIVSAVNKLQSSLLNNFPPLKITLCQIALFGGMF